MTKLAKITAVLTLTIALIGFTLSYNALYNVALQNGVPVNLAPLWPLLIDFALVVFSVSVLNSKVNHKRQSGGWALVIFFTLLTLLFNGVHSGIDNVNFTSIVRLIVASIPPIALFFSFERFMFQVSDNLSVKGDVKPDVKHTSPTVKELLNKQQEQMVSNVKPVKPVLTDALNVVVDSVKRGNNSRINIAEDVNISRQTIGKRVKTLINNGVLSENGKGIVVK